MANPELRIAPVTSVASPASSAPILVTGAVRAWFRSQRPEPFAACAGLIGCTDQATDLLAGLEAEFRASTRYSTTTSLSRCLLAMHHELRDDNRARRPEPPCRAAAIVAAASERGVYAVRVGPALVGSVRAGGVWARSADPLRGATPGTESYLGDDLEPLLTSEFFPIAPGDVILLLCGVTVEQFPDYTLAAALRAAPDLDAVASLLPDGDQRAAGLMIWYPPAGASDQLTGPWSMWDAGSTGAPSLPSFPRTLLGRGSARSSLLGPREATARAVASATSSLSAATEPAEPTDSASRTAALPPGIRRIEPPPTPVSEGAVARQLERSREAPQPERSELGPRARSAAATDAVDQVGPAPPRRPARSDAPQWSRFLPLLPLAAVLAIALFLMRGVLPFPNGADHSVAEAGRIVQEARGVTDTETRVAMLDQAIETLSRRAPGDEAARAILAEARSARDEALKITHVTRVHRFILPETENSRPAGLYKSDGGLFILDLGSQLLQRTDASGSRIDMAWRPGEQVGGEPLGKIVTAAWSPPRGTNTEGQLLVVDDRRSITAITSTGATSRRWWPPDNGLWQRLGPAAATHDDLFLLDPGQGVVWRYPARLAGASGSVAADNTREPRLSSVIDMATDGNLYLLYPDGQISKVAPGGGRLPFDGSVPDRPLRSPNAIFANPDLDRVWVLEPGEARVVEFTPDGTYVRQFAFPPDMVRNAVGLHVDPKAGELRVLTTQHVLLVQLD